MADDEEAGAEGGEGGDDAYDPQRALVAQSLEVNKLRQHVEVLKRANERIRDQYKQEIRSLLNPLIERHRKLQLENGKLQEKIEKLSVAPPGSDEALVEELRKLRHDHGILQKITEGLEADSRLARRLQAELEETHQRSEALDVRVADLDRERRRLEVLVAERDQTQVDLDESLETAQVGLKEWKEKYEKAQQAHKNELRGYQQQLGEAVGRYKALEKQHQDALFARDLLPILYEELQAEAATYDELTALFNGTKGNPEAYSPVPVDGDYDDAHDPTAPVTADASFTAYQPGPEATIAVAAGPVDLGAAVIDHDLDGFSLAGEATQPADLLADDQVTTAADMVGGLVDPLDDLPLDDSLTAGELAFDAGDDPLALAMAALEQQEVETGWFDGSDDVERAAMTDEPAALDVVSSDWEALDLTPVEPVAAEAEGMDLTALGFSDDELGIFQTLPTTAAEAPAETLDVLYPTGELSFEDAIPAGEGAFEHAIPAGDAMGAYGQDRAPVESAVDDGFDLLDQGLATADAHADGYEILETELVSPDVHDSAFDQSDADPVAVGTFDAGQDLTAAEQPVSDGLDLDEPGLAWETPVAEAPVETPFQAAGFAFGDPEPATVYELEPAIRADDELHAEPMHETPVAVADMDDDTLEASVDEAFDAPDFASQLAQSLGGFADVSEDDVEEVVWEDGPVDELDEDSAEIAASPVAEAFNWSDPATAERVANDLLAQEASWVDAAASSGDTPAVSATGDAGSWAAAMATDAAGFRHSETSISPEDIARLLDDDDDDLGSIAPLSADSDSPEFRIQPPKLEPPPLS